MTKYYDTDAFKKLNASWSKKLKKSGFDDIENEENGALKFWSSRYFLLNYDKEKFRIKEDYYRSAAQFLHSHKFKNALEYKVWEQHATGMGLLKIGKLLGIANGKARRIIEKLRPIMKKAIKLENDEND